MKTTIYTVSTIVATAIMFVVIAASAGITNGFDYLFEDSACTIASMVIWAAGTWASHAIYYVANKIATKIKEKEVNEKIREYEFIGEIISKKLGL